MSDNLSIWDKLGKTDPDQTKGFSRAGGFRGTAIKPVYTEQKMTEVFGPVGTGWGFSEPTFQLVPGSDGQLAVYCWLSLWYVHDGKRSDGIPGVGGDMVIVKQSAGLRTDDEAFKKAFTDAIGNAMKHLGMSADVHMGLFDDSKYVQSRKREEAEAKREPDPEPEPPNTPFDEPEPVDPDIVTENLTKQIRATRTADEITKLWKTGNFQYDFKSLPEPYQDVVKNVGAQRRAALNPMAA